MASKTVRAAKTVTAPQKRTSQKATTQKNAQSTTQRANQKNARGNTKATSQKTRKKPTQNQFLITHLRGTGRELTVAQAKSKYGIGNLRARVSELREAGYTIASRRTSTGSAAYLMATRKQGGSRKTV